MKHYSCMVDLLGKAGLVEEAEQLVKSMPMEPDNVILGALFFAILSTQKYFEMNRQVEYHYNNTGFPLESYIYLFEGPPYNYAELYAQESMYRSMQMGSNKFEPSSSGNTSYFGYVHAHEEDEHVPESVEEPEPSVTHARANSNPTAPGSPEECIRSHSDASSSQV
ncbi:hypothetical protein FRX31_028396 [Thalictrum thalictroides]|uniref:Pentatricopeptide repeat-containing protein n=1 Tax=Thalictrum thalictroides TaxID=46969 RepID=A0A7J6VB98_THATH|nr:hypothetical protein FRX31_028396 [Thalictrum thalictroides]